MSEQFLHDFAAQNAPDGGVLYDVNGDNTAVGVLIVGDGRTLQTMERQKGITEDSDPYISIGMPCGQVVSYQARSDFPRVNMPCPCGKAGHWVVYWMGDGSPIPPETEAPVESIPEEPADLNAMTVAELKAYALEHNIELGSATLKADIISAIESA